MNRITAERIKKLRESREWTKQRLSEELGMQSYTSITGWEKGENYPRVAEVIQLSKLFNVSTDYLLGLTDIKKWWQ